MLANSRFDQLSPGPMNHQQTNRQGSLIKGVVLKPQIHILYVSKKLVKKKNSGLVFVLS